MRVFDMSTGKAQDTENPVSDNETDSVTIAELEDTLMLREIEINPKNPKQRVAEILKSGLKVMPPTD